jgi:YidC/Oxa1 family membrane protein insertase
MARRVAFGLHSNEFCVATHGAVAATTLFPKDRILENQRNFFLAIVLSAAVLFGWSALSETWFPTPKAPMTKTTPGAPAPTVTAGAAGTGVPAPAAATPAKQDRSVVLAASQRVAIRTPQLEGSINLTGARIDDLILPRFRETTNTTSPAIRLLSPSGAADAYYAGFGWTGDGLATPGPTTIWVADGAVLTPAKPVTLRWTNPTGQTFALKFTVDANYLFTVEQAVSNGSAAPIAARSYAFVGRDGKSKDQDIWTAHVGPLGVFNGAANYDVNWETLDTAGPGGTRFNTNGGWLGFGDKYWLTALAPAKPMQIDAGFRHAAGNYQADFARVGGIVAPGTTQTESTLFFAGTKEVSALDDYEARVGIPLFGKAIDWGWFEIVEKPIFHFLHWLFRITGNFGVAIILLTFAVRGVMFPIAQRQFASMAAMRAIQPKMKAIQERYKDDKPRQQQEVMALYKSEKINPLAGCLPILLQIPIFFALYKVLILTIEMRHQPFVGWIHDLSAPDPATPINLFGLLPFTPPAILAIGILPIIVGITQFLQFKLNPTPMDATQEQVFKIMPFMLIFVMAPFAAGLQLYWMTTNILTIAQQKWLYSKHPQLKTAPPAASKT